MYSRYKNAVPPNILPVGLLLQLMDFRSMIGSFMAVAISLHSDDLLTIIHYTAAATDSYSSFSNLFLRDPSCDIMGIKETSRGDSILGHPFGRGDALKGLVSDTNLAVCT